MPKKETEPGKNEQRAPAKIPLFSPFHMRLFSTRGGTSAEITGVLQIPEYTKEHIRLKTTAGEMEIDGVLLELVFFSGQAVGIRGRICTFSFL